MAHTFTVQTEGFNEVVDITDIVAEHVKKSDVSGGVCTVFVAHSTCALTTIEFEPGLAETDMQEALERIAPTAADYAHNKRWGDGNGYAHVRAAVIGPSISIPVVAGDLQLGTWQQIVLIDFDNKPRQRSLVLVVAS